MLDSYSLSNGTVMSDFTDKGRFYIPEGKKHCRVVLTKIYATNQTWESESGCEYGVNNCLCFVDGLSEKHKGITKEVLTKERFFAKKTILTSQEIAEKQVEADRENMRFGATIGLIASLAGAAFGSYITYKLTQKRNS